MKNSILLLFLVLIGLYSCQEPNNDNLTSVTNSIIASKTENSKIVFVNETELKNKLEKDLKLREIADIKINKLYIDYSTAIDNEKIEIVQLIATNSEGNITIGYLLDENNGQFSFREDPISSVVKCEGCRDGCSPRRKENGDGYCTKCVGDYQKCTKTETI